MSAAEQGDQQLLQHFILADDDLGHLLPDLGIGPLQFLDRLQAVTGKRGVGHRIPIMKSWPHLRGQTAGLGHHRIQINP